MGRLVAVGLGALQGALFAGAFVDRRIDVLGVVLIGIGAALGGQRGADVCSVSRRSHPR